MGPSPFPRRSRGVGAVVSAEMMLKPAIEMAIRYLARLCPRQEHIVFGIHHRNDGAAVSDTAGPAGYLAYVEDRVTALQRGGSGGFGHGVIRAQNQVGYTDVESAIQLRLA